MKKQLDRLNQRTKIRLNDLTDVLSKLGKFYDQLTDITNQIDNKMSKVQEFAAALRSDEAAIRARRSELQVC